ncbi:MAG: putative rRNA maturation factor [Candidatus Yanofskybacteria bacterium GW2011_GWC2_41_9]|uniref:Endoribonuclease YbeY n=1 Tax=Candidatus Yanofskybacteria bacterium GW2011_GWC2_41_9 TaxID=1619029 RepID=A0A0G0XM68_9BACT|nr:MAG: putative rRNA maturation factor [Candidatus Yanofskybacteria bacterium GW2011_GWC2_41_9]
MIDLVFKNSTSEQAPGGAFFVKILESAAKTLKLGGSKVEISVNLTGETKIKNLNKKYRNKNTATNVLSFPLSTDVLKKYGILPLGDIFICLPVAKKEADGENISVENKLAWLTVHGFLHLLGYDHETTAKDAQAMLDLERKILRKIK